MASLARIFGRQCLLKQTSTVLGRRSNMSTKNISAYEEMSNYWNKNKALNRPLSPHVTIYKYHMSMVLSISNRIAAVALQGVLTGGSVLLLCLPGDFKSNMEKVKKLNISPLILNSAKFALVFPFVYHFVVGLRHFVWDVGYGYNKMGMMRGNWTVLAVTAVVSMALVLGIKPSEI